MSDPVTRLNATLEGRYAIERELGEGGMAMKKLIPVLAEDLVPILGRASEHWDYLMEAGTN